MHRSPESGIRVARPQCPLTRVAEPHRVWSIEKFPTPRRAGVRRASASVSASGAGSVSKTPCRSITG